MGRYFEDDDDEEDDDRQELGLGRRGREHEGAGSGEHGWEQGQLAGCDDRGGDESEGLKHVGGRVAESASPVERHEMPRKGPGRSGGPPP